MKSISSPALLGISPYICQDVMEAFDPDNSSRADDIQNLVHALQSTLLGNNMTPEDFSTPAKDIQDLKAFDCADPDSMSPEQKRKRERLLHSLHWRSFSSGGIVQEYGHPCAKLSKRNQTFSS